MLYAADATLLPPVVESLTVAVSVTLLFTATGFGLTSTPEVIGPMMSVDKTPSKAPMSQREPTGRGVPRWSVHIGVVPSAAVQ